MLVNVEFSIFAPSKEWMEAFEKMDYDADKVDEKFGSPFISNQHEDFKQQDGIYYTGLNSDSLFEEAGLEIYPAYGYAAGEAYKTWQYRKDQNMEFIPLFEITNMYKLAMFGSENHVEYGVCDNADQILKKWPHLVSGSQRHFITMTPIYKRNQSECGGWRWHKWGEYIGDHEIEHEYLYDEKDIEVVYVFHIYTLKPESGLGNKLSNNKKGSFPYETMSN